MFSAAPDSGSRPELLELFGHFGKACMRFLEHLARKLAKQSSRGHEHGCQTTEHREQNCVKRQVVPGRYCGCGSIILPLQPFVEKAAGDYMKSQPSGPRPDNRDDRSFFFFDPVGGRCLYLMLSLVPDNLIHRVAEFSTDCTPVSFPSLP